jgi:tRNA(Ile)-lysidine synthase
LLVAQERLFTAVDRVLVMVSGGQDSIALLEILAGPQLGRLRPGYVRVLHVNHHLRGEESDADQALVEAHCRRLGVEATVAHRPIEKAGGNVQERARVARREAALETAAQNACGRIALGHTADDQAESLLYRVGRYGGLAALRGMLPRDLPWVRPLLQARRAETARFCRESGLVYAVDRGNAYPGYARTGLRERVLPAWEAVLPGAVEGVARTAEVVAEVEGLVREAIASSEMEVAAPCLDVPRLTALSPTLRRLVLRAWLEEQGATVSRAAVLAVEELLQVRGSAGRDLEGGWRALREYDLLRVSRSAPAPDDRGGAWPPVELPVPGRAKWQGAVVEAELVEHFFAPDPSREAYLDARSLVDPVQVRGPLPGDRVRPLGAPGSRKLQDVLVDLHVPAALRPHVPVVTTGDDIVWVCGFVVAEKGRIAADTAQIVRLRLVEADS